eukprot:CAMPEP_0174251028 /NCGR_PEP_ID=MMETSP0439-20130205/997_1 /TAXON_ID=0 /ORGANISM="Stereomyxa ramosa, Strain Chinc5" /LENGTH=347 /DNA_ID=CAMNT_0015331249 /DNA_START=84 /DNA_END=1124 /DNA_ORIENTATION=+
MMKPVCYASAIILLLLCGSQVPYLLQISLDDVEAFVTNKLLISLSDLLLGIQLFSGYVVLLFIASAIVPGTYHKGTPLNDGRVITYKINGLRIFLLLCSVLVALYYFGIVPGSIIVDYYVPIFYAANIAAFALSIYLYIVGIKHGEKGDFIMGTELMPFVFGQPLKLFWLKPSMMAWIVINLSFLATHYEEHGTVSSGMIMYQLFTFLYVIDYFYHEERMTSTWDIIAEHFGLMLVWGDIVFIPFVFSTQAWFLLHDTDYIHPLVIALISGIFVVGYVIFRSCNSQKHNFKHNPEAKIWGEKPKAIGGKLLVSGFWGLARHINYTGDIIMGIAFAAPCRFSKGLIPW